MPFNGSGTFTLQYNWETEKLTPPIATSKLDTQDQDIATGLSNCMTLDGQSQPTQNLPMNGKRLVNLGDPASAQDAVTLAAMQAYAADKTGGDSISGLWDFSTAPRVGGNNVYYGPRAFKTSDTDRTSTTVLSADPNLTVTLAAGTWAYVLNALWLEIAGAGQGFSAAMGFTGTRTLHRAKQLTYTGSVLAGTANSSSLTLESGFSKVATTASEGPFLSIEGVITVTVQGALRLLWAQANSSVEVTRLLAGSSLIARKIS